jgi:hypothetical protein
MLRYNAAEQLLKYGSSAWDVPTSVQLGPRSALGSVSP